MTVVAECEIRIFMILKLVLDSTYYRKSKALYKSLWFKKQLIRRGMFDVS
jgi:hypothetical protein